MITRTTTCLLAFQLLLPGIVPAETFDMLQPEFGGNYSPATDTTEGGLWMVMDSLEEDIKHSPRTINDPELNRYINNMLCVLTEGYCDDVRVYIIRNPYFNASMSPNGMMQIWSGLLLRTRNEAQLATVLGHELGHYLRKHSLKGFEDYKKKANIGLFLNIGLAAATGAGGLDAATGSLINDVSQLALVSSYFAYNRSHEREADKYGVQLLWKAGLDTTEAAETWKNLIAEKEAAPKKHNTGLIFFATHPAPKNRVKNLEEHSQQLMELPSSGKEYGLGDYNAVLAPHVKDFLSDELDLHQFGRSEYLFKSLLEDNFYPGMVSYFLGELYRIRNNDGDRALSREYYHKALAQGDETPEAHRSLGIYYLKEKQFAEANQHFQDYLSRVPDAKDKQMIEFYISMGDPQ